ncbi:MAG: DUF1697 domain-containing protein [Gemmatimonadales bacterium]|jgi:uncharacterized protein (DUF1697 family)
MAAVVFMRGVNVGGRRRFRPAALARELSAFDVVNIGAAGTFVVHKSVSQATLRAELVRRLPFEAELMICRGRDVIELVSADPYPSSASAQGVRRFVSVLAKRPRGTPDFPIRRPAGGEWQVEVVGLRGRFALSLWRHISKSRVYPNEVVESEFAIPATTRNWDTITKICKTLRRA